MNLAEAFIQILNGIDLTVGSFINNYYFTAVDNFDPLTTKNDEISVGLLTAVDQYGNGGLHPLHYAIKQGKLGAVEWLLKDCAAPVHGKSLEEGWNAAHFAVKYQQCLLLKSLHSFNRDARFENSRIPNVFSDLDAEGRTPLMLAVQENSEECVLAVLPWTGVDKESLSGPKKETILHWAIRCAASENVFSTLLRSLKFKTDFMDAEGVTLVALAAELGNVSLLKLLVWQSADLMVHDVHRRTILHHAISSPNAEVLDLLLNGPLPMQAIADPRKPRSMVARPCRMKGATEDIYIQNPNFKAFTDDELLILLTHYDAEGLTPLMAAVMANDEDKVELLVKQHPAMHINSYQGGSKNTALHLAVFQNNLAIVQVLLKAGAGVNLLNAAKQKPIQIAQAGGMNEIVQEISFFEDF